MREARALSIAARGIRGSRSLSGSRVQAVPLALTSSRICYQAVWSGGLTSARSASPGATWRAAGSSRIAAAATARRRWTVASRSCSSSVANWRIVRLNAASARPLVEMSPTPRGSRLAARLVRAGEALPDTRPHRHQGSGRPSRGGPPRDVPSGSNPCPPKDRQPLRLG